MVERRPVKAMVAGPNPASGANEKWSSSWAAVFHRHVVSD